MIVQVSEIFVVWYTDESEPRRVGLKEKILFSNIVFISYNLLVVYMILGSLKGIYDFAIFVSDSEITGRDYELISMEC